MAGRNPLIEKLEQGGLSTVRATAATTPPPPGPDTRSALQRELDELRAAEEQESVREEIEEIREERRQRREVKRMEREARIAQLRRQINGEPDPTVAARAAQSTAAGGIGVADVLARVEQERNVWLGRLDEMQRRLDAAQRTQESSDLNRQLQEMRNEIQRIGQQGNGAQPAVDPMESMFSAVDRMIQMRTRVDQLVPPPPVSQQVDEVRKLELQIQEYDRRIALERVQTRREEIQAEKDKAIGRIQELMDGLRDVAGPALMAMAQSGKLDLSGLGRLVGLGGGGESNGAGAALAQGSPNSNGAPITFTCPNCKREQQVPAAQASAYTCPFPDCRYGPMNVQG